MAAMAGVHGSGRAEDRPPTRTYLEFVDREDHEPTREGLELGMMVLKSHREPRDDPIFRSLEALMNELAQERPTAPPPVEYTKLDEKVILCVLNRTLSPAQISRASGIPITQVYPRIRKLEGLGLLKHVRTVMVTSPTRKLVKLYRTNLKKVRLLADEGKIRLGIRFRRVAPRPTKISILVDSLEARAGAA